METRTRFNVYVGVAYGSDTALVEKVLLDCARSHPDIAATPEPFVRFIDFGNSSLDFQLFFWTIKTFRVENIKSTLRFKIDQEFRKNNIRIPFPQSDVHILQGRE
ncbi:MAG: mechanosensitive ion channel [Bacteroidales bacterium]|nr:mechanosensitive ion channel [Bacteroidales bacterium]